MEYIRSTTDNLDYAITDVKSLLGASAIVSVSAKTPANLTVTGVEYVSTDDSILFWVSGGITGVEQVDININYRKTDGKDRAYTQSVIFKTV